MLVQDKQAHIIHAALALVSAKPGGNLLFTSRPSYCDVGDSVDSGLFKLAWHVTLNNKPYFLKRDWTTEYVDAYCSVAAEVYSQKNHETSVRKYLLRYVAWAYVNGWFFALQPACDRLSVWEAEDQRRAREVAGLKDCSMEHNVGIRKGKPYCYDWGMFTVPNEEYRRLSC